jgi:hypothetical protein
MRVKFIDEVNFGSTRVQQVYKLLQLMAYARQTTRSHLL